MQNQQNYFYSNNLQQGNTQSYQKQIFQQQSMQFTMYLQYTIDTDMQNVLGVCMDYLALQETQPNNHELLSVFKNRMILQLNLSNTIHLDLQDSAKQNGSQEYKSIKEDARNKFAAVVQVIQNKFKNPQNNEALQMLHDHLDFNLNKETRLKQQELEENGVKYQFGEKVVQQLITAMQYQDQQYTILQHQKSYRSVTQQDLYNKAEQRYMQAKEKIKYSGIKERQLIPDNYPDGVKSLLGAFHLTLTAPPQYKSQLEIDFKQQILKLKQQKSGLAVTCLLDFIGRLNNKQMKNEINRWVDWISNENGGQNMTFQLNIQLDENDLRQFAQFAIQSQGVVQDYGQKRNIVEAVQLVLLYALSIINNKQQYQNPLQSFDLNVKDQISSQFLKLQDQFKSKFMKQFCQDVANQKVQAYSYRYEYDFEYDIALIRRLTS